MIVTVPLDTLLRRPLAPGAVLGTRTPVSGEAACRIACDAEIIRLIHLPPPAVPAPARDSGPTTGQLTSLLAAAITGLPPPLGGPSAALDIGRKSQGWTPRQRDAIHALHGGRCGWPAGCDNPIDVIHHRTHWADGGPTSVANAWPACRYHHWLVHEGGWRLLRQPDGTTTATPPPRGWKPGTIYRHATPSPNNHPPRPNQRVSLSGDWRQVEWARPDGPWPGRRPGRRQQRAAPGKAAAGRRGGDAARVPGRRSGPGSAELADPCAARWPAAEAPVP